MRQSPAGEAEREGHQDETNHELQHGSPPLLLWLTIRVPLLRGDVPEHYVTEIEELGGLPGGVGFVLIRAARQGRPSAMAGR